MEILATIALAAAAFVATNVDDVFLLLVFFADPRLRARDVALGQFLGIGALFAGSGLLALAARMFDLRLVGWLGLVPVALGIRAWRRPDDDDDDEPHAHGVLAVAAVTIANGGDNLGVYVPLFATRGAAALALIGLVFAGMTALWLLGARWLVSNPTLGPPLRRVLRPIVPAVLVALGVYIFLDARTWELFFR